MNQHKERTCNNCGWVAFAVTREYAEQAVAHFNAYYDGMSADEQVRNYGKRKAFVKTYETCFFCNGPHTNFRDAVEGDSPIGCTLQPIITEQS